MMMFVQGWWLSNSVVQDNLIQAKNSGTSTLASNKYPDFFTTSPFGHLTDFDIYVKKGKQLPKSIVPQAKLIQPMCTNTNMFRHQLSGYESFGQCQ